MIMRLTALFPSIFAIFSAVLFWFVLTNLPDADDYGNTALDLEFAAEDRENAASKSEGPQDKEPELQNKLQEISDVQPRPLFIETRKLPEIVETIIEIDVEEYVEEEKQLTIAYTGFLTTGSEPQALILDLDTGEEAWMPIGSRIHHFTLIEIQQTHIVFQANGEQQNFTLE
jgi:hypothetical protein